jgi:hypothetical protein
MVMKRAYYRIGFTAGQSEELWERWKRGEGLKAIGRVFGKPSSCIFSHLGQRRDKTAISATVPAGADIGRT